MTFSQSVKTCFSKYCSFKGRASRSEYWWWIVFTFVVAIIFGIPSGIQSLHESSASELPVISYVVGALLLLPNLGVLIRRLHDTGRSGWWWLIGFIPFLGSIILIVFCCQASQPFPNQYGVVPE